ncbi:lantibiotic dehydratase [Sphingobacterium sp. DR205]|uniref:lantibiotic dehydratase n=1 Tax=Sphingobacterium sp. DR205 TaxID=2713573 RepID=UPI0013E4EE3F|nr:lantibiotic dehydratase [Sphingobacterium sp. DR205]QIH36745.1 lantibiotic dehydratase [Sphingobacterium sp. DR205]
MRRFKHYGKAILRVPLNSFLLSNNLSDYRDNKLFMEGVYLSSKEFYKIIDTNIYTVNDNGKNDQTRQSLLKYWNRSCTRCTPFGTFASTSIIDILPTESRVVLDPQNRYRRSRIDMEYLSSIIESLLQNIESKRNVKWYINDSLYRGTNFLRYIDWNVKNNNRTYGLNTVETTDYLDFIIELAASGLKLDEVISILKIKYDLHSEEIWEYIDELINARILVPEIGAMVIQPTPFYTLEKIVEIVPGDREKNSIKQLLTILKKLEVNAVIDDYEKINDILKDISPEVGKVENTIQTDMFLNVEKGALNEKDIDKIITQVEETMALSKDYKSSTLDEFMRRFTERYDDNEISLLHALDSDIGVGYGTFSDLSIGSSDILDNLPVSYPTIKGGYDSAVDKFVIKKFNDFLNGNDDIINIGEEELKKLESELDNNKSPNSTYIMGTYYLQREHGFKFDLTSIGGSSGANLLTRFSYGGKEFLELIKEITDKESEFIGTNNACNAEIVHLPDSRLGNILMRPSIRDFEITFLGNSTSDESTKIKLSDLYVSVRNGTVFLKSKKHNRYIVPKLTSAHNYEYKSLPFYKFLCDLQQQNRSTPVVWDWGILSDNRYLPRVEYKNLILAKARWKIIFEDIFVGSATLPKENEQKLKDFIVTANIPKKALLVEGDNTLLLDFESEDCIDILLKHLITKKTVILCEYLSSVENSIIEDNSSFYYNNEVIIPIYSSTPSQEFFPKPAVNTTVKRRFLIGEECLFIKIYGGPESLDQILVDRLASFILAKSNYFEKFFFIRYKDEFNHLRLRFFQSDKRTLSEFQETLTEFLNHLVDAEFIHSWTIDVYNRELERYFPENIDISETLFHYDSLTVLEALKSVRGEPEEEKYRLLIGLLGFLNYLDMFNLNLNEKHEFAKKGANDFYQEFGGQKILQKEINKMYKIFQKDILSFLSDETSEEYGIFLKESFSLYYEQLGVISTEILKNISNHKATGSIKNNLISSYVHMFINRLFINQQRKWEMIIYHFMERYFLFKLKTNPNG